MQTAAIEFGKKNLIRSDLPTRERGLTHLSALRYTEFSARGTTNGHGGPRAQSSTQQPVCVIRALCHDCASAESQNNEFLPPDAAILNTFTRKRPRNAWQGIHAVAMMPKATHYNTASSSTLMAPLVISCVHASLLLHRIHVTSYCADSWFLSLRDAHASRTRAVPAPAHI